MRLEIERKFLVRNEDWRSAVISSERLRDGLIFHAASAKLRVRVSETRATLTFKGPKSGIVRHEFEYPIPREHAEILLAEHCGGRLLEKTRHTVPHGRHVWSVDVYEGLLAGVVLSEVELRSATEPFALPDWAGEDVTGLEAYKKAILLESALALGAPMSSP